jgi:predicted nucleotidyltransferase
MLAVIDEKRERLFELCREYYVRTLELFGSAATGEFLPGKSDLDFLVQFDRSPKMNAFRQFFGFQNALADLFECDVDLVDPTCMKNPYFIASVNQSRRLVYAA